MRKPLRMELERKLNASIDRYLARQTAAKEAVTAVREQRAAAMLGLGDPSDADLMASLETETGAES